MPQLEENGNEEVSNNTSGCWGWGGGGGGRGEEGDKVRGIEILKLIGPKLEGKNNEEVSLLTYE